MILINPYIFGATPPVYDGALLLENGDVLLLESGTTDAFLLETPAVVTPLLLINGTCDLAGRHSVSPTALLKTSTAQLNLANASWLFTGAESLLVADHADFDVGTGDFTIECDFYSTEEARNPMHFFELGNSIAGSPGNGLLGQYNQSTNYWDIYEGGLTYDRFTWNWPRSQWNHLALVRQGDTLRLYGNGVQQGAGGGLAAYEFTGGNQGLRIGGDNYSGNAAYWFKGYMSFFRFSNIARYPDGTTFTPPATMPAVDANTKLQVTAEVEQQDTPYGLSVGSSTTSLFEVNTAEKVGAGTLYSTNAGYHFIVASGEGIDLADGDFTMGCWHYSSYDDDGGFFGSSKDANNQWGFYWKKSDELLHFYAKTGGTVIADYSCAWDKPATTWKYLTAEREGSTLRIYIDGVSQSLTVGTAIGTSALFTPDSNVNLLVGSDYTGGMSLSGHLNLCSIHPTAIWKGDFTPPEVDWVPAVDNRTALLLHCNGVDESTAFLDSSKTCYAITANGTAQIDTAQSKFGGASCLLDGNSDTLTTVDTDEADFSTGDFTLEAWVRASSVTGGAFRILSAGKQADGAYKLWSFGYGDAWGGGNKMSLSTWNGSSYVDYTSDAFTHTINVWHHLACVRSGTSIKLFFDGSLVGTISIGSGVSVDGGSTGFIVGARWHDGALVEYLNGNVDEVRASKAIARWTTEFSSTLPAGEYGT